MNDRAILNVAYPFAEVCESAAGGAEQILYSIDLSISKSNNHSFVFAMKGSSVNGKLITFEFNGDYSGIDNRKLFYENIRNIIEKFLNNNQIDLIHFHGIDFAEYIPKTDIPILVTLHLPVSWYSSKSFHIPNVFYNCVSKYQFERCSKEYGPITYIENGVAVPTEKPSTKDKKYAISIGRICPEKGYHLAIAAAKIAKVPFVLAGKVFGYTDHLNYFHQYIEPHLNLIDCTFYRQVNLQQKTTLFQSARCLLVPSIVEETSSLVAMEALVNGVPVIGFKAGALNDIIKNGRNGYLVNNKYEMAEAIMKVKNIDPLSFYSLEKKKYSVNRMTYQYHRLYEQIISRK